MSNSYQMIRNEIQWFVKKIIIRFLTKNPFKIKPFSYFTNQVLGVPVDVPENISYLLFKQRGAHFEYLSPYFYNEDKRIEKYINKEPRFRYKGLFKEPDRLIYCMQSAHIIGQLGLVYDKLKRSFVEESAKEWIKPLIKSAYVNMKTTPTVSQLNGLTVSFLTNGADGGFYHFLFESLVKVVLYDVNLELADHYLFNGPETPWKLKWLNAASIDLSKIIWVDYKSHFKCEQLLFTNRLVNDQQIGNWAIQSLKKFISFPEINTKDSNKIIWLTRKHNKLRNMIWEKEILSQNPNIIEIDFESMDIEKTHDILQTASHIISPHGAALSNIFLCRKETKILELYPDNAEYKPCYSRLSSVCMLNHNIAFINFENINALETGLPFLSNVISDFINN